MSDDVENYVEFCASDFGSTVMDREAAYIDDQLKDADRVLDVGVGIGSIEERLDRMIVGLDVSMAMLQEARRRTDNLYVRGDATDMPFPRDTFDAAFAVTTLEFLDNYRAAVDEIRRVLRPEGRFVALILNPESAYVQRHMEKEESYFHRRQHDPQEIADYTGQQFAIETGYFLGIEGDGVFESSDPASAALYSVTGRKESTC